MHKPRALNETESKTKVEFSAKVVRRQLNENEQQRSLNLVNRTSLLKIPVNVQAIIDKLTKSGYEAYVVGGCVRDSVLDRQPDDWDVTTSAKPSEIKKVFARTVDTGIAHGTVTVLSGGEGIEVTTYRIDGQYEDHRHPDKVEFTTSLEQDLQRRDFTINAMAYNDKVGLVDPFEGIADLKYRNIRCVGEPDKRFDEDALRILRAVRFAAQLDFVIDTKTQAAIKELAPTLANISAERIQVEVVKLITSPRPAIWWQAWELGITKVIMPEFDAMVTTEQNTPYHMYNVGEHTIKVMENISANRVLRLAALLHDVGKPQVRAVDEQGVDHFKRHSEVGEGIARAILGRLKFDNDTTTKVLRLIRWHDYRPQAEEKAVRRAIYQIGDDIFTDFLELQYADTMGKSEADRSEKLQLNSDLRKIYQKIKDEEQCVSLKDLAISGNELIAMGIPAGPEIGKILKKALAEVLDDPSKNTKEYLIAQSTRWHQEAEHVR